jgi:hypothetical protein
MLRNLKLNIIDRLKRLKHPLDYLADLIYHLYSGDKNKIPLPLLKFIFSRYGGWAGISLYFVFREYDEKLKRERKQKIFRNIILPVGLLIILIFVGFFTKKDSFFFGFAQNLLADVVAVLLAIYILPQYFNKPKIYKLSLNDECSTDTVDGDKISVLFKVKNIGKEVFGKDEIYWEIYIAAEYIKQEDIHSILINYEPDNNGIPITTWKFYGLLNQPLFLGQEIGLLKINLRKEIIKAQDDSPQIYYRFRTIGGNFPTFENVTRAFLGFGYSIDKYPRVGEYFIKLYPE